MIILFFLLSTFYSLLSDYSFADELPVGLKAKNMYYDEATKMVTAEGDVEVTYKDIKIKVNKFSLNADTNETKGSGGFTFTQEGEVRGDNFVYDLDEDEIKAWGNIVVKRRGEELYCESLNYNTSSKEAAISNFKAEVIGEGLQKPLYLASEKINDRVKEADGKNSKATTCDYAEPHYHAHAKEFNYYPEDKIVGKHVSLYIGKVRIITLPYYVYYLRKQKSNMHSPTIGKNEVEGWFIKGMIDYFVNKNHSGTFFLDWLEKKGWATALEHNYLLGIGTGTLYLYHLLEKDTYEDDLEVKWSHQQKLGDFNFSTSNIYSRRYLISGSRKDETFSSLNLNRYAGWSSFYFNLENKEYRLGYAQKNQLVSLSQTEYFSKNWSFKYNLNYTKYEYPGSAPDEEMNLNNLDFIYSGDLFNLTIDFRRRFDIDGSSYTSDDSYTYYENLPLLYLTFKSFYWLGLGWTTKASFGNIREYAYRSESQSYVDFTNRKVSLGMDMTKTIDLSSHTKFNWSSGVEQYGYGTGEARYYLYLSPSLTTSAGSVFDNSLSYNYQFSKGPTPFVYADRASITNVSTIKETMDFHNPAKDLSLRISGGYDYENKVYDDLMATFNAKRGETLSYTVSTGRNLNSGTYRDLTFSLFYVPILGYLTLQEGLRYDLNSGQVTSGESLTDLTLGNTWQNRWHFLINHIYEFSTQQIKLRNISIAKDLHCWELRLSYSDSVKEWTFELILKAMPSSAASFTSGEKGLIMKGMESVFPQ